MDVFYFAVATQMRVDGTGRNTHFWGHPFLEPPTHCKECRSLGANIVPVLGHLPAVFLKHRFFERSPQKKELEGFIERIVFSEGLWKFVV